MAEIIHGMTLIIKNYKKATERKYLERYGGVYVS